VFVPALSGLGSPALDPSARGLMAGIGLDTTPADLVAGAILGIAARVATIAELLEVDDTIIVDGGLSRSSAMIAAVADLTGRTVQTTHDPETTLRGAAMLAATAVGFEMSVRDQAASGGVVVAPSIEADQRMAILDRYRSFEAVASCS